MTYSVCMCACTHIVIHDIMSEFQELISGVISSQKYHIITDPVTDFHCLNFEE